MTPGPSERTRQRARAQGWVTALAWDEGTLDDPKARPNRGPEPRRDDPVDPIEVYLVYVGDRPLARREARAEAIRMYTAQGWGDAQIGEQIRVSERTVLRIRQDYGIPPGDPQRRSFATCPSRAKIAA